eukprot:CAMPEP_0204254714 /NCGR_PEP_ID=MMETSP0468-20130131/2731_1 /ASSEMBLY_ACC=CAM_ASM_000383 /TAXON_ID=2969 /ORGANISM="Oxyrrhis marina" /LENGTH=68 /DNA_ID=CAMNT_0051228487 /DNA_START=33 /DNA_END=239 /DNA_ORIENTATION=+
MNFVKCIWLFCCSALAEPVVDVMYYYGGPGPRAAGDKRGPNAPSFLGQTRPTISVSAQMVPRGRMPGS